VSIDVGTLIDAARVRLGVTRASMSPIEEEGLSVFAEEALRPSRRNAVAVATALTWVQGTVDRLVHLEKLSEAHAPQLDTPIEAPLFIVGGARTGSTLLQHLLALSPELRTPTLAELWQPFAEDRALRIKSTRALLAGWPPAALELHPMAADGPEECHWIISNSPVPAVFQLADGYWQWLKGLDHAALRQIVGSYKRQVSFLQSTSPGRRWLSKTFAHMHAWPVLFDAFPDAWVIRLHRDPQSSVASSCSLVQRLLRGADPVHVGDLTIEVLADGLARMVAADEFAPPTQVIDIAYEDLCANPARVVCEIAAKVGLASPEEVAGRVSAYLRGPDHLRPARHVYALDDFGLTPSDVSDRLEAYLAWARGRLSLSFEAEPR
jgi:sulfotransferase family protein